MKIEREDTFSERERERYICREKEEERVSERERRPPQSWTYYPAENFRKRKTLTERGRQERIGESE